MSDTELTYSMLRNELARRVFQHTFSGPLLLVWSLGFLAFIAVFERPLFAMVWSGAMVSLGLLMAADYLTTPKVHEQLIRSTIQKRFPIRAAIQSLPSGGQDEVELLTEITLKIFRIQRNRRADAHLRRLIPLAQKMALLLRDSVTNADELERALQLTTGSVPQEDMMQIESRRSQSASSVRDKSIEFTLHELDRARLSANEILQQLQSLMLNLVQIEQLPDDPARSFELIRHTEETVRRLIQQHQDDGADRRSGLELQQTVDILAAGLRDSNFALGLGALQRLVREHAQLQPILDRAREAGSASFAQMSVAVEETYRAGLALLNDLLSLMRAANPSEKRRMENEAIELENNIALLRSDHSNDKAVEFMQKKLSSCCEQIELMRKQQLRVDELLQLVTACEASLKHTRIELAGLNTAESEMNVKHTTDSLRKTIDQALDVRAELKKLGL